MPIRINLLAEEQYQAELRRRDPLKRAIFGCVMAVLVLLLWFGWLMFRKSMINAGIESQVNALKALEDEAKNALSNLAGVARMERSINELNRLATNRVLWASFLNVLQQAAVEGINVNRVRVDQGYVYQPGEPKTNPPKLSIATEQIKVTITARDYGRPEDQLYARFRAKLLEHPWMKQHLASEQAIVFQGFSAPTPDRDNPAKVFVSFTMQCNFLQKSLSPLPPILTSGKSRGTDR